MHPPPRRSAEHAATVTPLLEVETTLAGRLTAVLEGWLRVAAPYHDFAGKVFANAAVPTSPLSPFSAESRPVHDDSPGQERTRALVGQAVPLLDRVLPLADLPLVGPLFEDVAGLLRSLQPR